MRILDKVFDERHDPNTLKKNSFVGFKKRGPIESPKKSKMSVPNPSSNNIV
jgi:hypothetical protein